MLRVVLQAVDEGRHRDASFTDVMDRCEHGKPTTQKQQENRSNNIYTITPIITLKLFQEQKNKKI